MTSTAPHQAPIPALRHHEPASTETMRGLLATLGCVMSPTKPVLGTGLWARVLAAEALPNPPATAAVPGSAAHRLWQQIEGGTSLAIKGMRA